MISRLLLAGASAFAFATPVAAQTQGSGLDTIVPADDNGAPASVAKTGDAVLDRLNALEAKVNALEARNKQLEAEAVETATRVQNVEVRAAKGVQPGVAPTFGDPTDTFTFHPRGTIQFDYAGYNSRAGGYDYSNGTDIRRARLGFEGTAWKVWRYRIEAELVKGNVNLLDAYVQYAGFKNILITVGQQKAPYSLEANGSDVLATFLERGMANDTFGAVGAERRVGVTLAITPIPQIIATVGIFGSGEGVQRNAATPDETYGINGRVTFEPINEAGRLVHAGASGYHVSQIAGKSLSIGDRPNTRIDNGQIETVALAPITTGPASGRTRGVQGATYWGTEAAFIYDRFSLQGEYNHLHVNRYGFVADPNFDGYYVFGTASLTGEGRSFRNGLADRVKPFNDFNPAAGHWGAFELAVRYDRLDLTNQALSPLDHVADSWTGGLNWYLNPNTRFIFNYIHFKGTNSPLVVAPVAINGTTAKGDAYATRLQFDF